MTDQQLTSVNEQIDDQTRVELSTPSLTHEWLHNGLIFRTTLHDSTRKTVDQYSSRWLEIIDGATPAKPVLFLLDISKVTFSIYGRTRSLELVHHRQEIKGYVAIVEKKTIEAQFSQMIIRAMDRGNSTVRLRMFQKVDEAVQWLVQMAQINTSKD